jgi:hypothetical protein
LLARLFIYTMLIQSQAEIGILRSAAPRVTMTN